MVRRRRSASNGANKPSNRTVTASPNRFDPLEVQAPTQPDKEEFPPPQRDLRAAKGSSKAKKKSNGKEKEAKKKGEKKSKSLQDQIGIMPKQRTKSANRPYDSVDSHLRSHRDTARATRRASLQLLAEQASTRPAPQGGAVNDAASIERVAESAPPFDVFTADGTSKRVTIGPKPLPLMAPSVT